MGSLLNSDLATITSFIDRTYQYKNKTIILRLNRKHKERWYFETSSYDIDDTFLQMLKKIMETMLKCQLFIPAQIISMIYKYYSSDLILDKNQTLTWTKTTDITTEMFIYIKMRN